MKAAVMMLMLVWALSGAALAAPSNDYSSVYHKSWTKKDGAPGVVFSMTQDHLGMLWFTSASGLYNFDGARFTHTDEIDGNRLLSPSTNVVAAIGDALWVGYTYGGLSVYRHGSVRHYGVAEGIPSRTMFNITRTGDDNIWVSTSAGLLWKDGDRWRRVMPSDGLPEGSIKFATALPDGTLLVYHPSGVYRNAAGKRHFALEIAQPDIETGLLRQDGQVLLVSTQHALQLFNPASGELRPMPLPKNSATAINITLDRHDGIWMSTEHGMQQLGLDLRPRRIFAGPDRFSGKLIYNDFNDREGNLWFTTENGIDYIRPARLNAIELPPRMIGGLSVVAAGDGTVWVGNTATTGNYHDTSIVITSDGQRKVAPMRDVNATLREPDGSVWFAGGGSLWHQQGQRKQRWELPVALRGSDVQAIAKGLDGRLWLSIIQHGVGTFDGGVWRPGGGHQELADRTAFSLHADAQGRIWFGYLANQVAMLEAGVVRHFDAKDGIAVGNVLVMSSRAGHLWIGGTEGVARLRGQRFIKLSAADGVPLYSVTGLVETAAGDLWLHGAEGLAHIGAADLTAALRSPAFVAPLTRFDYLDGHEGLPSPIRPLNSLSEAPDGRLWYATTGSVGWIDPASILRNPVAPAPQVTALRTDRQNFPVQDGVTLPEHTADLQIDFTAASLSIPERVRFRYRLLGFEDVWRESNGRRQAFYTNLGPGDYRFQVVAANEDGLWSKDPATLTFRITAHFTQTLWFKLACAAAVLAVLYLLYLARLAQLAARIAERLRERVMERERIARTLHDTILQSVQALILRFDMIKNALPADAPVQHQIGAALDAAQSVVDEGREQVMDLRAGDAHATKLSEALHHAGESLAKQYGFDFKLKVVDTECELLPVVRTEVLAIGKEALLNAAQHAASAIVTVELAYTRKHFRLTICDNGKGLDDSVRKSGARPGHWGLEGMRERAQRIGASFAIDSRDAAGVTVTLTLASRKAYD